MSAGPELAEAAYAKINLTLRIVGRRPDGYHALKSLVCFARVGDQLTLRPGAALGSTCTVRAPRLRDPATKISF